MHFFGGDQRKTFVQVKPHLVAEYAGGAGAGPVGLDHTLRESMAQQIFVLLAVALQERQQDLLLELLSKVVTQSECLSTHLLPVLELVCKMLCLTTQMQEK
jgi:hypothetical protein